MTREFSPLLSRRLILAAGIGAFSAAAGAQTAPAPQGDATAQEAMLSPKPCLARSGESTWDDGYDTLMKAFRALAEEASRARIQVSGRPLAHFTQTDDFGFKFTAMLAAGDAPAGFAFGQDVKPGRTPEGRTMRFTHQGAYDDIDTAYEAITAWLEEKGLTAKGQFLEEYLTDSKGADDASLEVNIYVFIE